jgi:hypothetical protein
MEQRVVKVVTLATGIVFPHARQAIQITRKTRRLNSKKWRTGVVYAVTSLAARSAGAGSGTRTRHVWSPPAPRSCCAPASPRQTPAVVSGRRVSRRDGVGLPAN